VFFASSFIRDAVGLLTALRASGYRPPAIMTSSAGFGLYTLLGASVAAEGVLSANAAALVHPGALMVTGRALRREYVTRLKARTGASPPASAVSQAVHQTLVGLSREAHQAVQRSDGAKVEEIQRRIDQTVDRCGRRVSGAPAGEITRA
jgi:hypothetical protein